MVERHLTPQEQADMATALSDCGWIVSPPPDAVEEWARARVTAARALARRALERRQKGDE
jgi:hypothetical protein